MPRRMDLNEASFPPSPRVGAAIAAAAGAAGRYPDPQCGALREALAARLGIDAARLVFGNGSDELLSLCAEVALAPGRNVVLPAPAFARPALAARALGAEARAVPVNRDGAADAAAMLAAADGATAEFYCATPNNPTGALMPRAALERVAREAPGLLVVDEAYFEFGREAGACDALAALAGRAAPWVLLRSFSKSYALAGLRVGYGICDSGASAARFDAVRNLFNVGAIAQAAALAALGDEDYMRRQVRATVAERERLRAGLAARGFPCLPSAANFLAVDCARPAAEALRRLAASGILAAPVGDAAFERHVRLTVGTPEDNDAALGAFERLR